MKRIAVIGAGLAGLTAALRLAEAGHEVTVLEREEQPGGRMGERLSGPLLYNTGARLLYPFGEALHRLLSDLGLNDALVPHRDLSASCIDPAQRHLLQLMPGLAVLRTPGLSMATRLRLVAHALGMAGLRRRVDPDDAVSGLHGDADESLADYIRNALGEDALRLLVEPVFRATRSWNPEEQSSAFYRSVTPHLLGRDTTYTLAEGMSQLPLAIAKRLNVRLKTSVIRARIRATGACEIAVEREGWLETVPADLVVCATEGSVAAGLLEGVGAEQASLLAAVRYNRLGIVRYALQGDLQERMEFSTRRMPTRISTWQQSAASGTRPASLYCQLTPEAAEEAASAGLTGNLDSLIGSEVRSRVPDLDARLLHCHNQWIEHMLPSFYPGYLLRAKAFLRWQARKPRRLYLCGDYLSQALLNGACASGQRTADLIVRHWSGT